MRVGDFDVCELLVGPPGCGKSFMMRERVRELGRTPAYVLAHDVTGSFRGQRDVSHHSTPDALYASLQARPGGIHVLRAADGAEVLAAAKHVAAAAATAAGGERARDVVPVILALDEVAMYRGMSPTYLDPELRDATVLRRHLPPTETAMLGIIAGTQYPAMVHPMIWLNCTRVVMFKLDGQDVADYLRRKCGMPRELLDAAAKLERLEAKSTKPRVEGRHYVVYRR